MYFRGIAREYCNDLSYNGCHIMNWSTNQESPFVSVLIEKLVFSDLVRKYLLFHGTRSWLPCYVLLWYCVTAVLCYRVTVLACYQEPTDCFSRKQFCSIRYTIIRFTVILFFHLRFFHPNDFSPFVLNCTLLNAFLNSLIAVTCSPKSPPLFLSPWW
jgi:hypothetical protein